MPIMQHYIVTTFYKFTPISDLENIRGLLFSFCKSHQIRGTILLANEGINATICGLKDSVDALIFYIQQEFKIAPLETKESISTKIPFLRTKVKIRKELISLGVAADPTQKVGTYVEPHEWNHLISDPDVILIDTRNDYEFKAGSFKNAINPNTHRFTEFPHYVKTHLDTSQHKKVAMFCTGGIRCEKASAYLLEQGFETVYQLEGGILRYLQNVTPQDSLWQGDCFIFDRRITV